MSAVVISKSSSAVNRSSEGGLFVERTEAYVCWICAVDGSGIVCSGARDCLDVDGICRMFVVLLGLVGLFVRRS